MITKSQVKDVLDALGEDFIVDIPAEHDGKGGYKLDYFELVTFLIQAPDTWLDRIVGYVNTKEVLGEGQRGVTFAPSLANLI